MEQSREESLEGYRENSMKESTEESLKQSLEKSCKILELIPEEISGGILRETRENL